MKITLDVMPDKAARIHDLIDRTESENPKQLLNSALTLLRWVVEETEKGHRIMACDPDGNAIEAVQMDALKRAVRIGEASRPEETADEPKLGS